MTLTEALKKAQKIGGPKICAQFNPVALTLEEWKECQGRTEEFRVALDDAVAAYKAAPAGNRQKQIDARNLASKRLHASKNPHRSMRCMFGEADNIAFFVMGMGDTWELALVSLAAEVERLKVAKEEAERRKAAKKR